MDIDTLRATLGDKAARIEQIGGQILVQGDCLEVMPLLGMVDAVVTDPPYGIGVDRAMAANSGTQHGKAAAAKRHYIASGWDDKPISAEHIAAMASVALHQIIFGGNYFPLPPARCWLVWDKQNTGDFADCELAWTNLDKPVRLLRHMWNGMLRKGQEARHGHPTQKPLGVMEWCIKHLPDDARTILDPFMGSGTTLVACQNLDRNGIGIELDPDYFNIACKRVDEATRQPRLFSEPKPKPTQDTMTLE